MPSKATAAKTKAQEKADKAAAAAAVPKPAEKKTSGAFFGAGDGGMLGQTNPALSRARFLGY